MSIRAMTWAYGLTLGSPAQKAVLIALADHADEDNSCWPSVKRLMGRTEFSERTVQGALKALYDRRLMSVEIREGKTRRYVLHVGEEPNDVGVREKHPRKARTPATNAPHPRSSCTPPPQLLLPTPAGAAPEPKRTIKDPSLNPQPRKREEEDRPNLPDWLPPEAWAEWCEYRRKLKAKGWTQMAARKSLASLSQLRDDGHDPREVIDQSIAAGWTGLFAVKQSRPNGQASSKLGWLHDDPMFDRSKP